jgi:ABC-type Fe3+ transport system substrate-binding protein
MSKKDTTNQCSLEQVRAVKPEAQGTFERMAEVAGIGITRMGNGYALKVNLQRPPKAKVTLPKQIRGVPVWIEVVGTIKKRAA